MSTNSIDPKHMPRSGTTKLRAAAETVMAAQAMARGAAEARFQVQVSLLELELSSTSRKFPTPCACEIITILTMCLWTAEQRNPKEIIEQLQKEHAFSMSDCQQGTTIGRKAH